MAENADARRMRLLKVLEESEEHLHLEDLAALMRCDSRTIRRDLDYLQQLLSRVRGLEVRRGRVMVARSPYSPGYFTDQLDRNLEAKQAIARAIVRSLPDEMAIALTAGSTTYAVACEIRRAVVEGRPPHNLIVFTNSVPSLLELVAAGVATGVLGEIYDPDDCAFHAPEFRSTFQPGIAIVGASGVLFGPAAPLGGLDLFSHRAEEAAFLKQLLQGVPEILIAADSHKLGRRHPWSFGGTVLHGKIVRLFTDAVTPEQAEELQKLAQRLAECGTQFQYIVAPPVEAEPTETPLEVEYSAQERRGRRNGSRRKTLEKLKGKE
ncbi:MAG TPA: HTH domain-containing protein [Chthonomonas sp.]|jgi:DeoR/GlpR family transcriptional regulator of sugar metabolism|uniref:HTH domain-containing protein n=1 Tax=Chthonomonas sp. TaxID=2282153 RepID=UPI002B4AE169|nr:HTH domain-containing protein [Chthonomonas sp.]HLH80117.1 HTH domain-containing protein [Chthonomonas sp.]